MSKRRIEKDPLTGVEVWHEYDSVNDITTIAEIQDCTQLIETNKATQNIGTPGGRINEYERAGIKQEWAHVASIPAVVIEKWRREDGINVFDKNHIKAVKKKLNSPEWRYLRTGSMRV